eukprot:UN12676
MPCFPPHDQDLPKFARLVMGFPKHASEQVPFLVRNPQKALTLLSIDYSMLGADDSIAMSYV